MRLFFQKLKISINDITQFERKGSHGKFNFPIIKLIVSFECGKTEGERMRDRREGVGKWPT